ncbi:MAG: pyridoxal-phosphate dependent enzyme [Candidatus Bathyarchaeota archaeon]|nr:pyridoxal-phosphate dependent enzyme [Candidatus Bathyarchaeota archaeon]
MTPVINEYFPDLEKIPWISLGSYPTKVEKLEKMGEARGFTELYIKRDDQSSPVYGGNKVRKLEYMLADAQKKGKKTLITLGGVGSNQVLATGIFGGELGFKVAGIMMDQPNAKYVRKNLLLDKYYDIKLIHCNGELGEIFAFIGEYLSTRLSGAKPYFVTAGASSEIGNMGFVNAAFELKKQIEAGEIPEPDYIIAACGSIGTSAGLNLGCKLAGLDTKVVAVRVAMPWITTKWRMRRMIRDINNFMRKYDPKVPLVDISEENLILLEDYLGDDYAAFTDCGCQCVDDMLELEDIQLEHTYTGKAFGGGLDWLKKQGKTDSTILFWNTYNSVDLSDKATTVDYKTLPAKFHKYFTEPVQEETWKG